jgi:probable DNA repair protein
MAALAEGATIVTPTPLLASVGLEQFNRWQIARGNEAWERPQIYSLDAWMTACWEQARFAVKNAPSLLSLSQERELWRQIIEQDRPDLFDVRGMASIAQRSAQVLAEYQIATEGDAWSENPDAEKFLGWHQTLQQRLKAENWITRSDLWRLLPDRIDKIAVTFAVLASLSPGLQRLGQRHVRITPSVQPTLACASWFEDISQELEHNARAIRYLLETDKARSIGVMVCDFTSHARELTRVLQEVLYPGADYPRSGEADHIHIQSGPWSAHPVISHALLLLELAQPRIHHASVGAILRSPFIEGAAKERSARALADSFIRRARELDFSLTDIEKASDRCPILNKILYRLRKITANMRPIMRPPDWSATFSDILEAAKWPAVENITEAEQRSVDQWNRALSELAALGLVSPGMTLNQAQAHLRAILSRPSELGDWGSPIQILDANSAEGMEFDHTFVVNASEDAWPSPISASPLIPYKLQRLHKVPGSRPESVAEERLRKSRSFFTSARNVQVSFTGSLAPSLRSYVQMSSGDANLWCGRVASQSYSAVDMDTKVDNQAPVLAPSEKTVGGSGILKSQSLCPFKAFAEYRLKARGDDDACFGFDALERGKFAHKTLEFVWQTLQNQSRLKSLSPQELDALVQESVEKAVQDDGSGPIRSLTSEAERERLMGVVSNWLVVEKERPEPFTVEKVEHTLAVELSGLKLELRADRIDRLKNGSLVLIDYKTGAQTKTKLENNRPQEPQLLVYAAAVAEPVDGLYFAELRNVGVRAVGHARKKHFNSQGVKDHPRDWDKFVEDSRETVHRLASEFLQGKADVDPQKVACEYCKVKPICRIGSAAILEESEE